MKRSSEVILFTIPESYPHITRNQAGRWIWNHSLNQIYFLPKGTHNPRINNEWNLNRHQNRFEFAMRKALEIASEMYRDLDKQRPVDA